MVIRSKTLRLVILVSTVLVTLIVAVQLFWLQKVYRYEAKQFNINISKTIRSLYNDMELVNDVSDNVQKVIENPKPDLYLVRIDCTPNLDTLWINLKSELTDFDVYTDCRAAIYYHDKNAYTTEAYIDLPDSYLATDNKVPLPLYSRDYSYILLFFPHRGEYILKQMFLWIASGGLLLLVLIGLGASIFYLYRQKFLNETQKDFVNNFTHEFKTPLAVIKIAAEVLKQPGIAQKPGRLQDYAGIIDEQTSHLQSQVERLLEIAYTDRVSLPLKKESVNINNLLQQAIHDLQPLIDQKQAQIAIKERTDDPMIQGDKAYLLLTFINLVENAIKYATDPRVTISTWQEANELRVLISDNGPGIDKEHQKKIFDRFYRIPAGDLHTVKGFGLGLSFVKKVIDAHGGRIEVESGKTSGTTFVIKIPRK